MALHRRIDAEGITPIVTHQATAEDAAVLRSMADRLERAAHPGVVRILDAGPTDDGGWRLRTVHGGSPLSVTIGLSPNRVAGVGAVAAATLADLHERGVAHGRLTPDRILLGGDGEVSLCGFGSAEVGGSDDDVEALGRILLDALDRVGDTDAGRGDRSGSTSAALRSIATAATDPDAARRPLMRRLAGSLDDLAGPPARRAGPGLRRPPSARRLERPVRRQPAPLPDRVSDPTSDDRAHRSVWPLVVVGALIVGLGIGVVRVRPPNPAEAPPAAAQSSTPTEPTSDPTTTTAETARSQTEPDSVARCVAITDRPANESDRCPHRVAVDGTTVTVDGRRFTVGSPGDQIAVGSFRCTSDVVVALLRPATGDVFVFATPGESTQEVTASSRMAGAVAFRAIGVSDRCHQLRVVDAEGVTTVVPIGSAS